MQTDQKDILKKIAREITGVDVEDLTRCEREIAEILEKEGYLMRHEFGYQNTIWEEYIVPET